MVEGPAVAVASKPEYAGVTFIETYLHDADDRHAAAAEAVGSGAMFALTPGKGIAAHREVGGVLHTYIELRRFAERVADIDFGDAAAAKARIAAEFEGWAPALTMLITGGETVPLPRTWRLLAQLALKEVYLVYQESRMPAKKYAR